MSMIDAQNRYLARLRVASLRSIAKEDESFRVLHDGTHGVRVNPHIRVRDQHGAASIRNKNGILDSIRESREPP